MEASEKPPKVPQLLAASTIPPEPENIPTEPAASPGPSHPPAGSSAALGCGNPVYPLPGERPATRPATGVLIPPPAFFFVSILCSHWLLVAQGPSVHRSILGGFLLSRRQPGAQSSRSPLLPGVSAPCRRRLLSCQGRCFSTL